jgi:hypothetical protein
MVAERTIQIDTAQDNLCFVELSYNRFQQLFYAQVPRLEDA